ELAHRLVHKNPTVTALLPECSSIISRQLIQGQRYIILSLAGCSNNTRSPEKFTPVCDLINGHPTADKLFQGNMNMSRKTDQFSLQALIDLMLTLNPLNQNLMI